MLVNIVDQFNWWLAMIERITIPLIKFPKILSIKPKLGFYFLN